MPRNDYNSLEPPQQGEDSNCQDVYLVYSSDETGNAFHSFGFTVPFILFSLLTVFTFWMLGLYKEEKWLDLTLIEFENSSVQEDPPIYANNSQLLGMGPEFSSDIAGDGPGYSDRELSDNSSSIEDFDSDSTEGSESSYDPIKEKKLEQKKRNARLRALHRRKQGKEAQRKGVESQKRKREDMGPAARRSEIDKRRKKGPEARRKDVEAQQKKREDMGPAARSSEIDKRRKKGPEARRSEIDKRRKKGPEARRKDVESQKKKR